MDILFIQPQNGYLTETVKTLREKNYKVTVIGYGYPPIYVEADAEQHGDIIATVEEVDGQVQYWTYEEKPELRDRIKIDEDGLLEGLKRFTPEEFDELCIKLDVDTFTLQGHASGNQLQMRLNLFRNYARTNNLIDLKEKAYSVNRGYFS